jgi:hypothetical protein
MTGLFFVFFFFFFFLFKKSPTFLRLSNTCVNLEFSFTLFLHKEGRERETFVAEFRNCDHVGGGLGASHSYVHWVNNITATPRERGEECYARFANQK